MEAMHSLTWAFLALKHLCKTFCESALSNSALFLQMSSIQRKWVPVSELFNSGKRTNSGDYGTCSSIGICFPAKNQWTLCDHFVTQLLCSNLFAIFLSIFNPSAIILMPTWQSVLMRVNFSIFSSEFTVTRQPGHLSPSASSLPSENLVPFKLTSSLDGLCLWSSQNNFMASIPVYLQLTDRGYLWSNPWGPKHLPKWCCHC